MNGSNYCPGIFSLLALLCQRKGRDLEPGSWRHFPELVAWLQALSQVAHIPSALPCSALSSRGGDGEGLWV